MKSFINPWFSEKLIQWYSLNKRSLPWRETLDPYKIWLSEIILQQTQVIQGLNYYLKFIEKYPSVHQLATASEDEVLRHWQGLGYYSRARNLHATAKYIAFELKGKFPSEYDAIRTLKGVGDYTASAIASFAFNLPKAVVDGNVYRLLSRVFDIELAIDSSIGKKTFQILAENLFPKSMGSTYNQAVMEFGSQYCKPRSPNCSSCIFADNCLAYKLNKVQDRPVKSKKTSVRPRYFNYIVFIAPNSTTQIMKREKKDIWQGLFEFPLVESGKKIKPEMVIQKIEKQFSLIELRKQLIFVSKEYKHQLSHQTIYARVLIFKRKLNQKSIGKKVKLNQLHQHAFPQLLVKFMRDCKLEEIV